MEIKIIETPQNPTPKPPNIEDEQSGMGLLFGSRVILASLLTKKYVAIGSDGTLHAHSGKPETFLILNQWQKGDFRLVESMEPASFRTLDGKILCLNRDTNCIQATFAENISEASMFKLLTRRSEKSQQIANKYAKTPSARMKEMRIKNVASSDPLSISENVVIHAHNDQVLSVSNDGTINIQTKQGATGSNLAQYWHLSLTAIPLTPGWTEKPFTHIPEESHININFSKLPIKAQERILGEDLISAMLGFVSRFIQKDPNDSLKYILTVNDADVSIQELVHRILPICSNYLFISNYIKEHSNFIYGKVVHRFTYALQQIMKDYMLLVSQLEHDYRSSDFTLTNLWFHIQPSLSLMDKIVQIVDKIKDIKGGALLCILQNLLDLEGDSKSKKLLKQLLSSSVQPYLNILERWIYHGELDDPFREFQIQENTEIDKESLVTDYSNIYWEGRFFVRHSLVPPFLLEVSDKILAAGKHLNVFHQCGHVVDCPFDENLFLSFDKPGAFEEKIEEAYQFASQQLLLLLMRDNDLIGRLRSIKHFFLIEYGDFISYFLDNSLDELQKSVGDITLKKLELNLEATVRNTTADKDPYSSDLGCFMYLYTVMQKIEGIRMVLAYKDFTNLGHNTQDSVAEECMRSPRPANISIGHSLKGVESFCLKFNVKWPLSLIISKKEMTKYQLIFRTLLYFKYVERRLCDTFSELQSTKELNLQKVLSNFYKLRHRMLHFLQCLQHYLMAEVLEPRWHTLIQELNQATTVDKILELHSTFLDTCLKECLLTNTGLLLILERLMETVLYFCDNITRFSQVLAYSATNFYTDTSKEKLDESKLQENRNARQRKIESMTKHFIQTAESENYSGMIIEFQNTFNEHINEFLNVLSTAAETQYDSHLANLSARLDYNGYYNRQQSKDKLLLHSIQMN